MPLVKQGINANPHLCQLPNESCYDEHARKRQQEMHLVLKHGEGEPCPWPRMTGHAWLATDRYYSSRSAGWREWYPQLRFCMSAALHGTNSYASVYVSCIAWYQQLHFRVCQLHCTVPTATLTCMSAALHGTNSYASVYVSCTAWYQQLHFRVCQLHCTVPTTTLICILAALQGPYSYTSVRVSCTAWYQQLHLCTCQLNCMVPTATPLYVSAAILSTSGWNDWLDWVTD
jgi:hypothetical protein